MQSRENIRKRNFGLVADSILEEPEPGTTAGIAEAKKQLQAAKKRSPAVREGTVSEREAAKVLLARKMRQNRSLTEAMGSTDRRSRRTSSQRHSNRVDFEAVGGRSDPQQRGIGSDHRRHCYSTCTFSRWLMPPARRFDAFQFRVDVRAHYRMTASHAGS
jgi:hypothetical protein